MQFEETRQPPPPGAVPDWASTRRPTDLMGRWANSLFKDHSFIRMAYRNLHRIGPDMYRCAQPTPGQVEELARMGVRTIINLRGRRPTCGSYFFEVRACAKLGVELIDFPVRSRDVPRKADLFAAREMWARLQGAAAMHCKAGADRVGFMSVLYQFVVLGLPMAEAQRQLSWRFGHLRQSKTGILDYFFDCFVASGGTSVDDFYRWVEHDYDPAVLKAAFTSQRWANVLMDRIIARE